MDDQRKTHPVASNDLTSQDNPRCRRACASCGDVYSYSVPRELPDPFFCPLCEEDRMWGAWDDLCSSDEDPTIIEGDLIYFAGKSDSDDDDSR